MNALHPIYTEKNDCQDCYKCVRWCPVKCIKVEKDSASIINEDCIHCGQCTLICPPKAKKIRNDLPAAQALLRSNSNVIASLAPSYISDFNGVNAAQMVAAIKMLGFKAVSETALGAEIVSQQCRKLLEKSDKNFYVSSACPSVVELIQKYYPEYAENITPLLSPMESHGKLLRDTESSDVKIIFFSPCVAKKVETDKEDSNIDVALTFQDLKEWFKLYNINPSEIPTSIEHDFYPEKAASASMYPVDGGMINSIKNGAGFTDYTFMSFSGITNIKNVFQGIEKFKSKKPVFLELLACEGGCINGPGSTCNDSLALKRYALLTEASNKSFRHDNKYKFPINASYTHLKTQELRVYNDAETTEMLEAIGKSSKADELNCGGCGYNSCLEFAHACLDKKAEKNMCVSYMRKVAHNKATALLQKMPSGVVMVDEDLKIIESNKNFAKILGEEIEMIYEVNPGLEGGDLVKLISFHKLFAKVLQSGDDILEKDVHEKGRLIHISIFTIQKHKVVCGLFRDMYAPEVRREEVIKRTQKVIKENLSTVQQIAYLLGENASRTEAILNSIIDSHEIENE